jgi:hypothetical protein
VEIPFKWHVPDTVITRFASNMTIQILENEFKISFFEMKPEIRLDPNAPIESEIRADCVASIIVSPNKMPQFIAALQKQLDLYNAKQQTE